MISYQITFIVNMSMRGSDNLKIWKYLVILKCFFFSLLISHLNIMRLFQDEVFEHNVLLFCRIDQCNVIVLIRYWRTMITGEPWTGGVWELLCMRWCVDAFHFIIRYSMTHCNLNNIQQHIISLVYADVHLSSGPWEAVWTDSDGGDKVSQNPLCRRQVFTVWITHQRP